MSNTPPPRPHRRDREVIDAVAKALSEDIADWLDNREENILDILGEVLESTWEWDGFKLTKNFEDISDAEGDSALVDIFERADHIASLETQNLVKKWIAEHNVKPKLKLGSKYELVVHKKPKAVWEVIKCKNLDLI